MSNTAANEANTLDFIRQRRSRAVVPERDTSLLQPVELGGTDGKGLELLERIKAELAALPQVARRSNIRVDETLLDQAEAQFRKEKITFETFFEAAYLIVKDDPQLFQQIIDLAKQRKKLRDQAGQLRRDLARLETYNNSTA